MFHGLSVSSNIKLITWIPQEDISDFTWNILQFLTCKLGFHVKFLHDTCITVTNLPVLCSDTIELPENSIKYVEAKVNSQNYKTMILSILKHDYEQVYFSCFSIFSIDVSYFSLNFWLWKLSLLSVLGTYFLGNIGKHLDLTQNNFWKTFSDRHFNDFGCHRIRAIS